MRGSVLTKAFQPDLFSAPFENLPLREAIAFYKHERDWANRLIAGDSLLVMNSLLQKESMAGGVQMIYIDPPYGIKYGSNFQPFTNKRDVKDRKDEDLTQEPEMIKAFRDTWELGIHSYLTYLRDRLSLARELLSESGSVCVQIGDENVHLARNLLDEIFRPKNCFAQIAVKKTSAQTSEGLAGTLDYVLVYAKDIERIKYRQLYREKEVGGFGADKYQYVLREDGRAERARKSENPGARFFSIDTLVSQRPPGDFPVQFQGEEFRPKTGFWKIGELGFPRLIKANRVIRGGSVLMYRRFLGDFPAVAYANYWEDTSSGASVTDPKVYVVQTAAKIVERCLLMTTDPGDLVLDPTCGSGTTAFVAEKWGRRWITCDTSRVAVTLAKQRLLTASYDYYELKYPHEGLKGGFIYKTVPHVTLKSIANNPEIDEIYERMHPAVEQALAELNAALQTPSPPAPLPPAGEGRTAQVLLPPAGEGSESPSPAGGESEARGTKPVWDEGALPPSPAGGRGVEGEGTEWEYIPHPPAKLPEDLKQHARDLRKAATDAENLMWQLLRNRRLANAKFRRQHPIGKYIADFYCDEQGLVIELDGGQHAEQKTYDDQRTAFLQSQGLTVLRFWNNQVLNETEAVLQVIWEQVARSHTPAPLPPAGEGSESPSPVGGERGFDRVAVSFGPEHAALEQRQVEIAMREAGELFPLPKMLVFCAFTFDPEAAKDIDNIKGITALKVQMNTDLLTEDLKKARASNESFWLMGQPDVEVRKLPDGRYEVEVHGFDYFDTASGELKSGGKKQIALWALDTDYDNRSLFPKQVFFPMAGAKEGWYKLKKDIRAELDEDLLEQFHGTVSLPLEAGENRCIGVKIVDDRGIESLKVIALGD
ncbi:DUF559 domain-containing protein [Methylococcus sp. Mc7]|uniref:DUF559 domain-containing protein n=1 Tax=Methylococcus sp. Mc7 TaxID=2860258 RepID=UPI001C531FED|nr:DUF559 domain-containing protein [Methylococcus sp. Mc7]QXP84660.1 DUF559 domain-containing protein [Methylococcus sp. Mc7]